MQTEAGAAAGQAVAVIEPDGRHDLRSGCLTANVNAMQCNAMQGCLAPPRATGWHEGQVVAQT